MRPMVIFLVKHFLAKDKSEIKKDESSAKTEQQGYPLVVKLQRPQVPSGELSEIWYHRHGKKSNHSGLVLPADKTCASPVLLA